MRPASCRKTLRRIKWIQRADALLNLWLIEEDGSKEGAARENCNTDVIRLSCSAEALRDPGELGNTGWLYLNQPSHSYNPHLLPSKWFCC